MLIINVTIKFKRDRGCWVEKEAERIREKGGSAALLGRCRERGWGCQPQSNCRDREGGRQEGWGGEEARRGGCGGGGTELAGGKEEGRKGGEARRTRRREGVSRMLDGDIAGGWGREIAGRKRISDSEREKEAGGTTPGGGREWRRRYRHCWRAAHGCGEERRRVGRRGQKWRRRWGAVAAGEEGGGGGVGKQKRGIAENKIVRFIFNSNLVHFNQIWNQTWRALERLTIEAMRSNLIWDIWASARFVQSPGQSSGVPLILLVSSDIMWVRHVSMPTSSTSPQVLGHVHT